MLFITKLQIIWHSKLFKNSKIVEIKFEVKLKIFCNFEGNEKILTACYFN